MHQSSYIDRPFIEWQLCLEVQEHKNARKNTRNSYKKQEKRREKQERKRKT